MPEKEPTPKTQTARRLRRAMTIPERRLWNLLRNRSLAGLKFRRQVPIDPFVVDFYYESARLAVEFDGASHDGRGGYDKTRQRYLEAQGARVLRVHNEELLEDAESVLLGIARAAHIDLRSYYGNLFGPAQTGVRSGKRPRSPAGSSGNIDAKPTLKRDARRNNRRRPPTGP